MSIYIHGWLLNQLEKYDEIDWLAIIDQAENAHRILSQIAFQEEQVHAFEDLIDAINRMMKSQQLEP